MGSLIKTKLIILISQFTQLATFRIGYIWIKYFQLNIPGEKTASNIYWFKMIAYSKQHVPSLFVAALQLVQHDSDSILIFNLYLNIRSVGYALNDYHKSLT